MKSVSNNSAVIYYSNYYSQAVPREGIVYIASIGKNYKIGCSQNVDQRLRNLAQIHKKKVFLYFTIKTNNMYTVEKYLHSVFSHKRIKGEIFDLSNDDLGVICKYKYILAKKIDSLEKCDFHRVSKMEPDYKYIQHTDDEIKDILCNFDGNFFKFGLYEDFIKSHIDEFKLFIKENYKKQVVAKTYDKMHYTIFS